MHSEDDRSAVNPLAQELNRIIEEENPNILGMLSGVGKRLFFPRGILSQTAEAKEKAHRFNATIGMAKEQGEAMHLPSLSKHISGLDPDQVFPYAPAGGLPGLREKRKEEEYEVNPALSGKTISTPIVTAGMTHGLTLVGEMFVDPGDLLLLPDKMWGNYRMIFEVRKQGTVETYPLFSEKGGFNVSGLYDSLNRAAEGREKVVVILNFPNNPTGYSLNWEEAQEITGVLTTAAGNDLNIVLVCDDSYFGLFYDESVMRESLFGLVADSHERILSIRLDGATKEDYVWGFRTGFLTYNALATKDPASLYEALEKKTAGCIRGTISNAPHLSQSLVLAAKGDPEYGKERKAKYGILRDRAVRVEQVLAREKYSKVWEPYPFNSGYFMCLKLKDTDAEELRLKLLEEHGIGVIAVNRSDLRIAFSCIEVDEIEELFDTIFACAQELGGPGSEG